jgi:serine/threonine protein kinase
VALIAGTRLGAYEITAQIGVGGMGEVYRATDTNLKRAVALKVLPESVAADTERLARFQREAEVLASLNHPNIAAIYGLERSGGITALVMELVEGPTLAHRIAQGAVPIDEALPIAKQIAEALEAAHEQGIIHRDLKPPNIKVRPDGTVKVLDFGLAKTVEPVGTISPSQSLSPTITTPAMTQAGMILGTVAYMSPEQARGKAVDERTDVWSFGCVLYEMLTGQSAFTGETISDTIAKILERDPNWRVLSPSTPPRIRKLLRSCLEKDQQHRVRHIVDARLAIQEARATLSGWRLVVGLPVVAAMIALGAMTVGGAWWYVARSSPPDTHEPVLVCYRGFSEPHQRSDVRPGAGAAITDRVGGCDVHQRI